MQKLQLEDVWREIINTQNVRMRNTEVSIIHLMQEANKPVQSEIDRLVRSYGETVDDKLLIDSVKWSGAKRDTTIKRIREQLLPILIKRDNYIVRAIKNELEISYYQQAYYTEQFIIDTLREAGVTGNFNSILTPPKNKAFELAIRNNPLTTPAKYKAVRDTFIANVLQTVESGINAGSSIPEITKRLDQLFGFRDSQGKLVISKNQEIPFVGPDGKVTSRKPRAVNPRIPTGGQTYNSVRIARTEANMMRSAASIIALTESQASGIDERLIKISTLDDRTRSQSAEMDGQISREDGKFIYPDGNYYYQGRTGNQRWDINDRGTTAPYIEGFEPEFRREKVVSTGEYKIQPYGSFREYASRTGLKKNIYGEKYVG